jgi:hypothetical protein
MSVLSKRNNVIKNTPKTVGNGLRFNGVSDYLQLSSMTMDSIEIECLIDAVQPQSTPFLVSARDGLPDGIVYNSIIGSGWNSMVVDGVTKTSWGDIPKGSRTKVKLIGANKFTDNVSIFTSDTLNVISRLKGTLYKVTCYLAGNIVAQYDFENPKNIVGNQVIPNAKNLIPSFDDARWTIHANAKVLGKDVLHLDATANAQHTIIDIPVNPSTQYTFLFNSNALSFIASYDGSGNYVTDIGWSNTWANPFNKTFTTLSNIKTLIVYLSNNGKGAGSFDFIRPQLYQLSGLEGTINGTPINQQKSSKRNYYSKR